MYTYRVNLFLSCQPIVTWVIFELYISDPFRKHVAYGSNYLRHEPIQIQIIKSFHFYKKFNEFRVTR